MSTPMPGKPVRGSVRGIPIMAIFDLLGRSWSLGVVWQLQDGPLTFRELQEKCEYMSPTILNKRTKELREAKIIDKDIHGYILTQQGYTLIEVIRPLGDWARQWEKTLLDDLQE
jgi:DNA-binding HxlR family transcriptional regulator